MSKTDRNGKSTRQFDRYRLQTLDNAQIRFNAVSGRPEVRRQLFNISYKGLGFKPQVGDENLLPVGEDLSATLELGKERIPIRIEIVYHQKDLTGARIKPERSSDIQNIIGFITPLELGQSLRKVESKLLRQQDAKRALTWYVGKNNTELVVWRNRIGELLEFRLVFYLYAISGDLREGNLRTADQNPAELGYIPIYEPWPEEKISWHKKPRREALILARELLSQASQLLPVDQEEISAWVLGASPANP